MQPSSRPTIELLVDGVRVKPSCTEEVERHGDTATKAWVSIFPGQKLAFRYLCVRKPESWGTHAFNLRIWVDHKFRETRHIPNSNGGNLSTFKDGQDLRMGEQDFIVNVSEEWVDRDGINQFGDGHLYAFYTTETPAVSQPGDAAGVEKRIPLAVVPTGRNFQLPPPRICEERYQRILRWAKTVSAATHKTEAKPPPVTLPAKRTRDQFDEDGPDDEITLNAIKKAKIVYETAPATTMPTSYQHASNGNDAIATSHHHQQHQRQHHTEISKRRQKNTWKPQGRREKRRKMTRKNSGRFRAYYTCNADEGEDGTTPIA